MYLFLCFKLFSKRYITSASSDVAPLPLLPLGPAVRRILELKRGISRYDRGHDCCWSWLLFCSKESIRKPGLYPGLWILCLRLLVKGLRSQGWALGSWTAVFVFHLKQDAKVLLFQQVLRVSLELLSVLSPLPGDRQIWIPESVTGHQLWPSYTW